MNEPRYQDTARYGRIDDADLNLVIDDTVLCGSAFNQCETAVNGNLLFNPNNNLRTIDWHRFGKLLITQSEDRECVPSNFQVLHQGRQHGEFLATVDNVLSDSEIEQILQHDFQPQHFHYNRSDRVIVIDEDLAHLLWSRLESVLMNEQTPQSPLGFRVSGVDWHLEKANPAMRINSYKAGQGFDLHRDAQFAESPTARSVLSVVLYLNDVPNGGGETRFILKHTTSELPGTPMMIPEEMEYYRQHGGIERISVKPVRGRCLMFTHDWLHESLPLHGDDGDDSALKVVLRTDIVATCSEIPVFMTPQEVRDYQESLALFHEAEQMELRASTFRRREAFFADDAAILNYNEELRFLDRHCEEYYSKSMYLRYRYPRALEGEQYGGAMVSPLEIVFGILGDITVKVLEFLPITEAIQLSVVCPALKKYVDALETELNDDAKEFCKKLRVQIMMEPTKKDFQTAQFQFRLKTKLDFHEHYEAWCRVTAVLVIYEVTHAMESPGGNRWYCARFIPQTGQVLATPLDRLIHDAFHNVKCYGAVFAVEQQGTDENVDIDFAGSVDRSVMLRDYGVEFTGQNLFEHVYAEIKGSNAHNSDMGIRYEGLTKDVNVIDPFIRGRVSEYDDDVSNRVAHYNLPSHSKGTSRHIFKSSFMEGNFEMADHSNNDLFEFLSDEEDVGSKKEIVFNQCIFDFERCEFVVERSDFPGPDGFEYRFGFSDLADQVAPFYHAAADHNYADMSIKMNLYDGNKVASHWPGFQHQPGYQQEVVDERIRVTPKKMAANEWIVTAEWPVSAFPVTL